MPLEQGNSRKPDRLTAKSIRRAKCGKNHPEPLRNRRLISPARRRPRGPVQAGSDRTDQNFLSCGAPFSDVIPVEIAMSHDDPDDQTLLTPHAARAVPRLAGACGTRRGRSHVAKTQNRPIPHQRTARSVKPKAWERSDRI